MNDGWNLAQVKISRDYDFMIFVEVIRAGGEVGQIAIGQAHNMFSRIFRIQKYEFFTIPILYYVLSRSAHRTTNFTNPEFQFPNLRCCKVFLFFLIYRVILSFLGVY